MLSGGSSKTTRRFFKMLTPMQTKTIKKEEASKNMINLVEYQNYVLMDWFKDLKGHIRADKQ